MDLNGKVALVTGGAHGIGLATVKELLKNGLKGVTICDINGEIGEDACEEVTKEFGSNKAIFVKTDVTSNKDLEEAFKKTIETFKSIDIVINNAGIVDDDHWEREININSGGIVRGTQLALQYMGKDRGGKGGTIVNTASVAGLGLKSASPIYDATKFFVVGYCHSMTHPPVDVSHGVRILCMCPGLTDTPVGTAVLDGYEKFNVSREKVLSQTTVQQPGDVAEGIVHILREAESGTIWVSNRSHPVYQVVLPDIVKTPPSSIDIDKKY